jgi:hypothetical protein
VRDQREVDSLRKEGAELHTLKQGDMSHHSEKQLLGVKLFQAIKTNAFVVNTGGELEGIN